MKKNNSKLNKILKPITVLVFFLSIMLLANAGDIRVRNGNLNITGDLFVDNNVLFVNSTSNNVGIGKLPVSDINVKLDVSTYLRSTTSNNGYGGYQFADSDGLQWSWFKENVANPKLILGRYENGTWKASAIEVQRDGDIIFNDGNIGIGTSSPSEALYVVGNVSADGFIDRSEIYKGDALVAIKNIKSETDSTGDWQKLDHLSLPNEVLVVYKEPIMKTIIDPETGEIKEIPTGETRIVYGRSINKMMDINTRAIEQLLERIEDLEAEVATLKNR